MAKPPLVSVPETLQTLGDHIRTVRLQRHLLQRDIAALWSTCEDTITGWESGRCEPSISYFPAIFAFLGYFPFPDDPQTIVGQLLRWRLSLGITVQDFCRKHHVDARTLKKWEHGIRVPPAVWQARIRSAFAQLPDYLKEPSKRSEYETTEQNIAEPV